MCSVRMPEEEDPSSLLALFSARGLASWFMLLEVQLEASLPASVVITFCTLLSVSVALAAGGTQRRTPSNSEPSLCSGSQLG